MSIMRTALLYASRSAWLAHQVRNRRFAQRAVARFMPGEDLDSALGAAESLKPHNISTLLTYLGENVTEAAEADRVTEHYLEVLERIRERGLDAEISINHTQLGIDIALDRARANLMTIVERANELGNFVWIDMEGSGYTDSTLRLFRQIRKKHDNLGVCLQAYLRRTTRDLEELLPLGPAIRVVKGAYKEPPSLAFSRRKEVDENYLRLAHTLFEVASNGNGTPPALGTHDLRLIGRLEAAAAGVGLKKELLNIQMLYGIQREAQLRLAAQGYRMRVLISYGDAWFPWYMRRLAERPANVLFVLRNLFAR